jgi:polyphosphate kinase
MSESPSEPSASAPRRRSSSKASAPPPVVDDVAAAAPPVQMIDRELSWLAFNVRVLEEALDPRNPLLERLRFLTIFHTNLDEFFMIRVSGLKQQAAAGVGRLSEDGLTANQQLHRLRERLTEPLRAAQTVLRRDLLPALAVNGITVLHYHALSKADQERCDSWYQRRCHPILTPLAVSSVVKFPFISNLSTNLALFVRSPKGETRLARVKVPHQLPQFVNIDGDGSPALPCRVVPLVEIIAHNLGSLFPGMETGQPWSFRVTRDADIEIREDEADDLLHSLEEELRKRRFGEAVRLQTQRGMPARLRAAVMRGLVLKPEDVYEVDGWMDVEAFEELCAIQAPELKYPLHVPRTARSLSGEDLFQRIRLGDVLIHHPFDAFTPVVEFVEHAARDPKVLAIKQTLYRTSGDSPVIKALEKAIEHGKQVAAVVELKARFDEENNIVWARRLEESGVHVIYGVPGLKTHGKLTLVLREEEGELRRYAHIGTGNYNPVTSRVYTDLGLFTCDADITADVVDLFNQMTGFALPPAFRKLAVAPRFMKGFLLSRIEREIENARSGRASGIIAKCNALTDPDLIRALYDASRAGVPVDLIVRGICCLVPGVPGMSENIRVRSVLGRFLEHSRVYWFENAGAGEAWIGSADWMGRNLERRIEVLVPMQDPQIIGWLRETFLARYLGDTGRSRLMQPDGSWIRHPERSARNDVHVQMLEDPRSPHALRHRTDA